MKFLALILTYLICLNSFAAPLGVTGQNQNPAKFPSVIKAPNNLITDIGSSSVLIENGNTNILSNPSFEHSAVSTGWTSIAGTLAAETSTVIEGKKALKVTLSAQALNLTQDSTLYAAQFADSVQGLAMVRVKTSVSGIKVCSRQAGTTSTTLCVSSQGSGKWELLKVPFVLGATSNGIAIHSNAVSVTGDVYVDAAFVGAVDLKVDSPKVNSQSLFLSQTATFGNANITGALTTNVGDTTLVSYNSSTGVYTVNRKANINATAYMVGASAVQSCIYKSDLSLGYGCDIGTDANTTVNKSFDIGESFVIRNGSANSTTGQRISVIATEITNGSTYSSTNADFGWTPYTPTYSNFGTVTGWAEYKRSGDMLLLRGRFTSAVPAAAAAKISLPVHLGNQLTVKSFNSQNQIVTGNVGTDYTGATQSGIVPVVLDAERTVIQFGFNNSRSSFSVLNASTFLINGSAVGWTASVNVETWDQSNIIIGQFNGLESCADSYQCTDLYSANVSSAGVVSNENLEWITGNAAGNAPYVLTFKTGLFTVTPNCWAIISESTAANVARIDTTSTTSVSIRPFTVGSAPTSTTDNYRVFCQKGTDASNRTVKAVASDANVKTVGAVGVDIQSVYFGAAAGCATACTTGTCFICNQVGSKITSVTWTSTGQYRLNGIDGTKYNCTANAYQPGVGGSYPQHERSVSTSTYAAIYNWVNGGTVNAGSASVTCIGIP